MSDLPERIEALPPEKLALFVRRLKQRERPPAAPLARRKDAAPYPLSFAQERLWLAEQLRPGTPAYNLPVSIPLPFTVNVAALEQSINEISRRHESLRTTFEYRDGHPMQVIQPSLHIPLKVFELSHLPASERGARVEHLAAGEARRPFDLARGPLLRTVLLRLSEGEHVLLLTMHHIISDAWSMGVFFRELAVLYEAYCWRRPSPLPEPPLQYAHFAVWQRQWLRGAVLEEQLRYWRRLEGAPPLLELPTDRPRLAAESPRGAVETFALSPATLKGLRSLSLREGTTLFMTSLAVFLVLLHRYTGQCDLVLGTPIANRNRAELEGLIGFFVNMLVLRTDLSGDPSFRGLLRRVREVTLGAYAHQDMPFEKLVEELQPERRLSHNPLFQVAFVLQNAAPVPPATQTQLEPPAPQVGTGAAKFDLTLSLAETEQSLLGAFEYNSDLFERQTILRMIGHFQTLLKSALAEPEKKLYELCLLGEQERRQLLREWNDTARDYPRDRCVHELFEAQAARTPDATAVIDAGVSLTYAELDEWADELAARLRARGAGPETRVGVMVARSAAMVAALLGVLKAGGAYVPLDPRQPRARLRLMAADAGVRLVASGAGGADVLGDGFELIDVSRRAGGGERTTRTPSGVRPENLAYVIYTSGSTGQPKGTMNTHRSLCNLLHWTQATYPLAGSDRVLQKTAFSFDPSTWEIFWPLVNGATLLTPPPEVDRDNACLMRYATENRISIMLLVSSAMQVFLEEPGVENCRTLRHAFCGGEPVPLSLRSLFASRIGAPLHNIYGPTEACIITVVGDSEAGGGTLTMPIGRPVANTRVYLLDRYMQPVPAGVPGELYIGGDCLGRGYHGRPALTAERFVPDPFSGEPGARLYQTGDLARYLPDRQIEFLRRMDHQVKVRGFRVELGEIEAALSSHPDVRDAVAAVRQTGSGDRRLVAYVVAKHGRELYTAGLKAFLRERLPDYMQPGAFLVLAAMPLNPHGKVDRNALPDPEALLPPETEAAGVAPRTQVEAELARIWCEVLGRERVGIHDNFFELGGHSLSAMQVASRARAAFSSELPMHRLFEMPTIAELAAAVADGLAARGLGGDAAAPFLPRAEALPAAEACESGTQGGELTSQTKGDGQPEEDTYGR